MDCLDYGFDNFKKTAFRVETLPEYAIYDTDEYDEYKKFITNQTIEGFANSGWLNDIHNWCREGKKVERIRVIPLKVTDYFKYEVCWCYQQNIKYGESIIFVEYEDYKRISTKYNIEDDFWIFDNNSAVILKYNNEYEYLDCEEVSKDLISNYVSLYKELKLLAIEFEKIYQLVK